CGAPFRGLDSAERPELAFLRFAQRRLIGPPRARVISPSEERQDGKRDRNDERNHAPGYHDARAVENRISATLRRGIDDGRASGSATGRVSICNPFRRGDAMPALFPGAVTRRKFLGPSAAALAASALPSAAPAQGARFRRFEISDPGMPPRVLDSYKKGIREMLNRPP